MTGFIIFNKYSKPAEAGANENVYGWAWSGAPEIEGGVLKTGLGWISFNNTSGGGNQSYGVNIESDGRLTGYAWAGGGVNAGGSLASTIGWIKFGPLLKLDAESYPNCPLTTCPGGTPNYPAKFDSNTKKITGWARACAGTVNGDCNSATRTDGWDGWILLGPIVKGGTDYGVWIDTSVSPTQFRNWAWGSDIIGWISFNCKEGGYNEVTKEISDICSTSDYKVMTNLAVVSIPTVSNLETRGMFCAGSPNGLVELSWKYNGTYPQAKYRLQVDNDSDFSSPVVDATSFQVVQPGDRGTAGVSVKESPGTNELEYNKEYYWRVEVWDNQNTESIWSSTYCPSIQEVQEGQILDRTCFKTPKHPYPRVDFSWFPENPSMDELVQFCSVEEDKMVDPGPPPIYEIICSPSLTTCYDSACVSWNWTIPDPSGPDWEYEIGYSSSSKNPLGKFKTPGPKNASLEVWDSDGYHCAKTEPITSQLPLPEWKEIAPF